MDGDMLLDNEDIQLEEDVDQPEEAPKSEPNPLQEQFEFFKTQGILYTPENFEFKDENSFTQAVNYTKENIQKEIFTSLVNAMPDDLKEIVAHGVSGKTLKDYLALQPIEDLTELDIKNPFNQEKILKTYYQETTNYPKEKIDRLVSKLKDNDSIYEEAIEALEDLKGFREARKKEIIEETKRNNELVRTHQAQFVAQLKESIPAIETDQQRQHKLQAFLLNEITTNNRTDSAYNLTLQTIKDNPKHLAQLASMLLDYDPKKGFTFDRFVKKGKTEAITTLEEQIKNTFTKPSSNQQSKKNPSKDFDWEKFLGY